MHERPIYVVRWRNFRDLIGPQKGAITAAAAKLEKSQGQVSHFGGKNPIKNIGDDIAAEIEKAWGKPPGWLDQPWGEGTVNERTDLTRRGAQIHTLEAAILARALFWLDFEERANGPSQPMIRAGRLLELCRLVQEGGGELSPSQADQVIDAARQAKGEKTSVRSASNRGGG
jgi:hypothetical protein